MRLKTMWATLALALASAPLAAQSHAIDRGSMILSGGAQFSGHEYDDDDGWSTFAFLNPSVQYFVTRGLALGGQLSAGRSSGGGNTYYTIGIGPAASYYFGAPEETLHPFVSASLFSTRSDGESTSTYQGSVGLMKLISPSVGLDASLFYTGIGRGKTVGVGLGFSAFTF
jgi:hypothetical protein